MEIDAKRVIIRKVEEGDIDTLTSYRLDYLTELQGERSDDYIAVLRKELSSFFLTSMKDGSFF